VSNVETKIDPESDVMYSSKGRFVIELLVEDRY
jgi:hypothetical protein